MTDVITLRTVAFDGDKEEVVSEHTIPNDTRHAPMLTIDPNATEEPITEAVLFDGRVIPLGFFELDKTYELMAASDHPHLLEKGAIHAKDSFGAHISVEGLLVRGLYLSYGKSIAHATHLRLDAFGKEHAYVERTDKATFSGLTIEVDLPIFVPGHGGVQFRVWLYGRMGHVKGTVDLRVIHCKALGLWNDTEFYRPDAWAEDVEAGSWFEKWFYDNQPIEGYRVKATRIYSANLEAYEAAQHA